jgi:hypothetical protein
LNGKDHHDAWFKAKAQVFIDFGDDFLYALKKKEQILNPFWYVEVLRKKHFITMYSNFVK